MQYSLHDQLKLASIFANLTNSTKMLGVLLDIGIRSPHIFIFEKHKFITYGVLQGSILRSLLFILNIYSRNVLIFILLKIC